MLLRGKVPEDQLEFDLEIEKTARRNQSKKREEKKKQGQAEGESSNTFNSHNQTDFQMAENRQIHLEGHWEIMLCNKDQGISPA